YMEHVLLTNHANYGKSHFVRHMRGPLLGEGRLSSERALCRGRRRIAAPAFHNRRVADLRATVGSSAAPTLARWRCSPGPFDGSAEMMALTLDIICRTMFSTDVTRDVAAVRRMMDQVVGVRVGMLDLFGLPNWIPRRQTRTLRRVVAEFEAFVAGLLATRRAETVER